MCQNDTLTVETVALRLSNICPECHFDLNHAPTPRVTPYCRRCGAETPVLRMLNGGFDKLYEQMHDNRTLESDRERLCKTGAHKVFERRRQGFWRWHFCPLCGQDLDM